MCGPPNDQLFTNREKFTFIKSNVIKNTSGARARVSIQQQQNAHSRFWKIVGSM